ncbi:MAG: acyl-CoA synthetase [Micromonosporaceae bacterium]
MAVNIADLFEHAVDLVPERVAVACGDRRTTYAQLEERANKLAHHLAQHGVGPGSHVGVYARNSVEFTETMIAVFKLRALVINVNYRYVENELRYLFDNADLVALVHDHRYADKVAAVRPDVPNLKHVLTIGDETGDGDYETAIAAESGERDFAERSPDDRYILYTGGTTGYPKGVMWRHEDIWRVLGGGIDFMSGEPLPDEWAQAQKGKEFGPLVRLCAAPLIHGNAQWAALAALFAGDKVVFVPQFDPHEIWRAVDEHQVNVLVIIGDAMARPLLEAYQEGDCKAEKLYAVSSSAALFSPSLKQQYLETFPNTVLTDAIGSSETGFAGISLITKDTEQSTAGPRVRPGPKTIVIDEFDKPIEPGSGQVGRLARGGHVPLGYYKDEEKTKRLYAEVDGERYTVPGDLATTEADGTIVMLGRGNTCVNTGGEKVFPEEVEAALKSHPDVFDALVIGLPDERLGQAVAAVVEPRPGATLDAAALDAHVHTLLAGYKAPRKIWVADEIGRTVSGKADYRWAKAYAEQNDPLR